MVNTNIIQGKAFVYDEQTIQERASATYQTHHSKITSTLYKISKLVTQPALNGAHNILVFERNGVGHGAEFGPGGESKKFAIFKAVGWFALTLSILPLVILGIIGRQLFHPGRGQDGVRFMDATKGADMKDYVPPSPEKLHIASYNIAGLPAPVDAVKDVISSTVRAKEFVKWMDKQEEADLPLFLGLQEAFDQDASEIITNGLRKKYPYAVTSSGWSQVPFLGSNSGLQFHSRVPIKSAAFFPFQDLKGLGVRASNRGVLKVELDLGGGKSAIAYVSHTQPHCDEESTLIRKNELMLIAAQMRADRLNDLNEGIDRQGNYFLLGDLNVGNVDDETFNPDGSLVVTNEHKTLRENGEVLAPDHFYDPYLEEHNDEGYRTKGSPIFLEKDVDNESRRAKGWTTIEEGQGTFYSGADRLDRGNEGYGTAEFLSGPQHTVENCRYDYILRLEHPEDLGGKTLRPLKGRAEARNVISENLPRCPISDHKMVSAIFG